MDIDNTYSIEEEVVAADEVSVDLQDASSTSDVLVEDDGFVLDFEKVVVTVALFVITFVVLSPRGSLRHAWRIWCAKRQRGKTAETTQKEQVQVVPGHSPKSTIEDLTTMHPGGTWGDEQSPQQISTSASSSPGMGTATICTGMVLPPPPPVVEELTDEAKFAELWPAIRMSDYRRLVLPPDCKLVDKPKKVKQKKKPDDSSMTKENDKTSVSTEDNPARRLVIYLQQFLLLLRSIYSYDYDGAARTVIQWLQTWIRYRRYKPTPQEEDEDDEDDASASGGVTPRMVGGNFDAAMVSPMKSPVSEVQNPPKRLVRSNSSPSQVSDVVAEEKKEAFVIGESSSSPHKRSSSLGSEYEVPLSDYGESDVGEAPTNTGPSPLTPPQLPSLHRGSGTRIDKFEPYRNGLPPLIERSLSTPQRSTSSLSPRHGSSASNMDAFDVSFTSLGKMPAHLEPPPLVDRQKAEDLSFFDAAYSRESIQQMSREVGLPDKNGYIVGDEFLDPRDTPLLVFVNSRSGPQQGHVLIMQLRRLLNPIQVWDLADGGPEQVLESFSAMTKFRILVCGGDGTVSWIISALEEMAMERWPPIAILPLGTGNDLARIHGWGGGYNNESLILILEQISNAYISLLDRWEMSVINHKKNKVKAIKSFTNYLGVGVDAQAALQVHMLRENRPQLFFSRAVNKAWYAVFGAEDAIKASCAHLPDEITLVADGVEVPLPPDSQGIILLNIDSYSGGVPLWSHGTSSRHYTTNAGGKAVPRRSQSLDSFHAISRERSNTFERVDSMDDLSAALMSEEEKLDRVMGCEKPSSCQDGMLDIVSIRGTFHLGQIRVGLSNAERLCQCREVTIKIKKKVAVQIDGEPWRQNVCTLHVKRKKEPAIMLHRSPDESGGVETEMAKLLDWAKERGHIDRNVHYLLMKEFSRRIENKTRQRRVRSQENVMLSLKRAIVSTSVPSFPTSTAFSSYPNPTYF